MNTCATHNTHSNISVKLPRFAPDEKLAFVERACAVLIESRFSHGRADAWVEQFSFFDKPMDDVIRERPRFAWQAAAADVDLPAEHRPSYGNPGAFARCLDGILFAAKSFSVARLARGSPW